MVQFLKDLRDRFGHPSPHVQPPAYGLDQTMDYRRYGTAHKSFRCWPDVLIERIPVPEPLGVLMCGALFFLAGAVIAVPDGFFGHYSRTPAVYIGCAGFALTLGIIHWASSRVHNTYEQLRPIFCINDHVYAIFLTKWLQRLSQDWKSVLFGGALYPFVVLAVGAAYAPADFRSQYHLESVRPSTFTDAWYFPEYRTSAVAILLVLGALVGLALGTGIRLLLMNYWLLLELRMLPVIPVPTLVRARLRRMADLYVGTALSWSIGVMLFGVLFYGHYDAFSFTLILVLFIFGAATFGLPQLLCRHFILNSYDRLCAIGIAWLYRRLGVTVDEREPIEARTEAFSADHLADLSQLTDRPKTWIYDGQDVLLWVITQIATFLTVFAHDAVWGLLQG